MPEGSAGNFWSWQNHFPAERLMDNEDKASWRAQDAGAHRDPEADSDKKPERGEDSPSTG